ncbi:unnamed protein product [Microthlaspi erraticum]|uniref:Uncharacterized protein n=1 Tax=Microthlaspi erraticum TaxID=1685480 RepID=A0A6D2HTE8_9BRAS|nr:unnamed protein product [Microthlaspi erraticum]
MGDGHQDAPLNWVRLTRSSLWLLFLLFFIVEMCVASLALVEWSSLEAVVGSPESLREVLVLVESYSNPGSQTGAPPGQLDPQLDRASARSSWSVESWNSSSFSASCLLLPLARKKRLCEALGQGAFLEW